MRHALWGIVLLSISGCCCDFMKKESFAEVPLTLSDAKKLEKSGATVTVERRTKHMGGGSCHSEVCLLLLPIILFDAVFPETWDEVVVTKGDEVLLSASYTTGGELIHAQHLKDGVIYETRFIVLESLGKKVYVDSAKIVKGERVPLPLSSQHDFIGEERKYLERTKDPTKRAEAILEAGLVLEKEGLEFATERLGASDEPEESRAEVVRRGCTRSGLTPGFEALLPAAHTSEGPLVKLALINCATLGTPEREAALIAAVPALCSPRTPAALVKDFHRNQAGELVGSEPLRERIEAAGRACPAGGRRALINLWLSKPVDDADLAELMKDSEVMEFAHSALRQSEPNQRRALVQLIIGDRDGAARILTHLASEKTVLEPELLEALGKRYLQRTGLFEVGDRARTLELFDAARAAEDGPKRVKSTLGLFAAAAAREKDAGHKSMLEAVRVVLGDTSRIAAASAGLKTPVRTEYPTLDEDVVAFALARAGCSKETLEAAATQKKPLTTCR